MNNKLLECRPGRMALGFSLVEVVMATGIATFALLVIFSLMPAGLGTLQESGRQLVSTEIFNTVGAELAATPFDKLEDEVGARFPAYFDEEGMEVAAGDAVFTVRCDLHAPELDGTLRRATVSVGYRKDPVNGGNNISKRSFLLADRGL